MSPKQLLENPLLMNFSINFTANIRWLSECGGVAHDQINEILQYNTPLLTIT